jgi:hypothetical protein
LHEKLKEKTMSVSFKGIASKIVAAAKDFKSAILKAAEEAPVIAADVQKDAPEVEALLDLAFPGAAAIEQVSLSAFEALADAVEAAGPAASANGLSVTLDKTLIADIQASLPALKAFAAKL